MEVIIVGAGLAGLSAAITLAEQGIACRLISAQPSERAQSVMAAGGINGALNTMGEDDCTENHYQDTCKAGCYIGDPEAIRGLTETAPEIIRWLAARGVPFNQNGAEIAQRSFGGQRKKRTAYARSSTGKIIMSALIDEARRYEAAGLITRYCHHEFVQLLLIGTDAAGAAHDDGHVNAHSDGGDAGQDAGSRCCVGVCVRDAYTGAEVLFYGPVILATGGINGVFPGMTTGTTTNSGAVTATVFAQGVRLGNLEMIQYHPTTIGIAGKRCLVSEAARGEGGRLYIERGGERWYFMEERYPTLGNLMPRDVVSREMYFVTHDPACGDQVYLDMTHLSREIWEQRLPDLRQEIRHYLAIDPAAEPVPVEPGIHYFMGGIDVDVRHRTNVPGLYAAGECCCQYHGANRLGGNSMLGAIYGGRVAAEDLAAHPVECGDLASDQMTMAGSDASGQQAAVAGAGVDPDRFVVDPQAASVRIHTLGDRLYAALGIVREAGALSAAREETLQDLAQVTNVHERARLLLAQAMLESALLRRESRGAHYRSDYPERDDLQAMQTVAMYEDGQVQVRYREVVGTNAAAGRGQVRNAGEVTSCR